MANSKPRLLVLPIAGCGRSQELGGRVDQSLVERRPRWFKWKSCVVDSQWTSGCVEVDTRSSNGWRVPSGMPFVQVLRVGVRQAVLQAGCGLFGLGPFCCRCSIGYGQEMERDKGFLFPRCINQREVERVPFARSSGPGLSLGTHALGDRGRDVKERRASTGWEREWSRS